MGAMFLHHIASVSKLLLVTFSLLIMGCGEDQVPGRWYTQTQVEQGRVVYQTHCAVCHGSQAEGIGNWQVRGPDGQYPPPPLDGSAHAWHHPLPMLQRQILQGGIPVGGAMPGFAGVLGEEDVLAAIAFFQSQWSDDIYLQWETIDNRAPM